MNSKKNGENRVEEIYLVTSKPNIMPKHRFRMISGMLQGATNIEHLWLLTEQQCSRDAY